MEHRRSVKAWAKSVVPLERHDVRRTKVRVSKAKTSKHRTMSTTAVTVKFCSSRDAMHQFVALLVTCDNGILADRPYL